MKLTKDQVKHVANLARINLNESDIVKFQTQLSGILDYVEQLNEVVTDKVLPTAQVTGLTNITREDKIRNNVAEPAALLECSPLLKEKGQIKVKNVF